MAIPVAIFREARTNGQYRCKVFDPYNESGSQCFAGDAGGSQIARGNINADGTGSQRFRNIHVSRNTYFFSDPGNSVCVSVKRLFLSTSICEQIQTLCARI